MILPISLWRYIFDVLDKGAGFSRSEQKFAFFLISEFQLLGEVWQDASPDPDLASNISAALQV